MNPKFVHLHIHSEYSLVDGIVRIKDLASKLKHMNMPAAALCDQSNLFAMVKYFNALENAGIKPIVGADVWLENEQDKDAPFRLMLLCMNSEGYKNLTELVSRSYIANQSNGKALIKKEWLTWANSGLIAIANSRYSDVGVALLNSNKDLAHTLVEHWMGIFQNRFYLEVVRTGRKDEEEYIEKAVKISLNKDCPLVATNDVIFLDSDDFDAHEARVCINQGITLDDPTREINYSKEQYLRSEDEMVEIFSDLPEALENSVEIAKRCNLELVLGKVFLPNYPVPNGLTIDKFLENQSKDGLRKRLLKLNVKDEEQYYKRLDIELNVINKMGFPGYFLIVADFIRWAKKNDIPVGPGRGSGAGSLVAYALDITDLDPIEYELLFERFLNPERVSMPDFDIDFCMEGRDRVIDYVAKSYGRGSVSQIITYGTMAAKAVIRDVGRVFGHPYGFVDKIAKLIPNELGITLDKALSQEEPLKQRYQDEEEVRTLIDLARRLEGVTRNVGKHAGGVVIAPSKLTDFTPLYCDSSDGSILSQFDKNDVESIGLVKFDFLGLRTLTIIHWALIDINNHLKEQGLETININDISLTCQKTFDLLRSTNTTAVFQLESRGMKDLIRRLIPDCFEEIIALVALFRPGPLQSGMVDDFINRKHGRSKVEYAHPDIAPILEPTYGVILYQEQVMQIAQVLSGYTLGGADLLRRAMGKKKPEEMAQQRETFVKGAENRGVDPNVASYIFDLIEKFAGYGFNKSHSAAYAMITYQTAWLKAHYPAFFMAAVMSSDMSNTDKVVNFIEDAKSMGLKVLPPDINTSHFKFSVLDNDIVYGLGAIKGVGQAAIDSIVEARNDGRFRDLYDLCARIDLRKASKRVMESLVKSGALDGLGKNRAIITATLEHAVKAAEQLSKNKAQGQDDLFGQTLNSEDFEEIADFSNLRPWPDDVRLANEKETLGFYLSGHPINQHKKELSNFVTTSIANLRPDKNRQKIAGLVVGIRTMLTKRGDRMAFIALDDSSGRQEVAIFADIYRDKRELFVKDNLIIIEGVAATDDYSGGIRFRAEKVFDLSEVRANYAKRLNIKVDKDNLDSSFTDKLKNILTPFVEGNCSLDLDFSTKDVKAKIKLGEKWNVVPDAELLDKIKLLCGEESVEVIY